ncbi:right-handed parallel beta-helix repeat-containing protein [Serratia marcescens]|uniref:right-handed parallel beta-helix repeat-containing protein n=1 Tax=Serratia marcescens TaxID=615 RepID=UPI002D860063|nr:right-handed parallel beta-helix repeat-containing protein [Serratia marcescens]MEB5610088.1 right-handed parallel beta-helix repeat-containing protein [Serratia marcescens]
MAQMSKEDPQFNTKNAAAQVNDGGEFAEYTPEQFGAVGDGLADDRDAVSAMFAKVAIDAAKSMKKRQVRMANIYRLTLGSAWQPLQIPSNCHIYGGGEIHLDDDTPQINIFNTVEQSNFIVEDLRITRKVTQKDTDPIWWYATRACTGMAFTRCENFTVRNCVISMHTDALGLSDCSSVTLENNLLKDLGEEPIAVRGGRHITIQNNELTNHQGDGILLKTGVNREAYDILIVNNHIHDGHKPAKPAGAGHTQRGGGGTLNNEVTGTPHSFTNLTVANNHIVNTSYGIALGGISDINISNNYIKTIERFGIQIDYSLVNNPTKIPTNNSRIIGNHVEDTVENGIDYHGNNDISVTESVIADNFLNFCGTSTTSAFNGIAATEATLSGNIINNCKVALFANSCVMTGNKITNSGWGASQVWIKLYGDRTVFSGNRVTDSGFGYIRFLNGKNAIIEGNVIKLAAPARALELGGEFDETTLIGKNAWDCAFKPILSTIAGVTGNQLIQYTFPNEGVAHITPQMFGAKGDWNDTAGVGTDDTQAFKQAIAYAISQGCKKLYVPAGNYYITDTLNLGGENYTGDKGIAIEGENWISTKFFFKPTSNDHACFESKGGSGIHTNRYISDVTITPAKGALYTGTGYRINGSCFMRHERLLIMKFFVNLHLLNGYAGAFTEFVSFHSCRFHRGLSNILMESNGGDSSFHGVGFHEIQCQIKVSGNPGDGGTNMDAGVGLELRGNANRATWYNGFCYIHLFGGVGATAIKLTRTNTDNILGQFTCEGETILQSDGSTFECRGGFYNVSTTTYNVATEPVNGIAAAFVFDNMMSNTTRFANAAIADMAPRQLPWSLADRASNGAYPAIFHGIKGDSDNLFYAARGGSTNYHYFGGISPGNNLQGFEPGVRLAQDGASFISFAPKFTLGANNNTTSSGVSISPADFSPQKDIATALGQPSFKWSGLYTKQLTVADNGVYPAGNGAYPIGGPNNQFSSGHIKVLNIYDSANVNGDPVGVRVAVPASAVAPGKIGQWSADSAFFYVCTAANTWRRVALTTW